MYMCTNNYIHIINAIQVIINACVIIVIVYEMTLIIGYTTIKVVIIVQLCHMQSSGVIYLTPSRADPDPGFFHGGLRVIAILFIKTIYTLQLFTLLLF